MIITTEAWIDNNFNHKYFPLYKNSKIEFTKNNRRKSDRVVIL